MDFRWATYWFSCCGGWGKWGLTVRGGWLGGVMTEATAFSLSGLSDGQLRDAVVEFERQARVALAGQLAVIAEIARRSDQALAGDRLLQQIIRQGNHDRYRFVADEVAVELGWSKVAASSRFHLAVDLTGYPHTEQAFAQGRIDLPRVREIVDQLQLVEDATFVPALEQAAVAYAATHTRPQLAAWLKRRLIATEPDRAEGRRQHAINDRRVAHYPGPDGTGHLWAQLDAAHTSAIWSTINQVARTNRDNHTGDDRTIDQHRADALVELILGRGGRPQERQRTEIQVTLSAQTLAGLSNQPGELAGHGPITAQHARELAHGDARWRRILFDDETGQVVDVARRPAEPSYRPSADLARTITLRDATCRFPGCRRAATGHGIDLDHTKPWPGGPTHATNLAALCRSHHYLKTHAGWTVNHHRDATLTWTTPNGHTVSTYPADHRPDTRGDPPF